jgi:hypothetical protein
MIDKGGTYMIHVAVEVREGVGKGRYVTLCTGKSFLSLYGPNQGWATPNQGWATIEYIIQNKENILICNKCKEHKDYPLLVLGGI